MLGDLKVEAPNDSQPSTKKKENFHSNLLSAGDFVLVVDKDTVNENIYIYIYICVYSLYTLIFLQREL